ncbi:trimethylamine monooxygenase-like [Ruditapes philippinarum]|uniref:trimethylamine monooxygenase-like n=1 Tax=Ruditapes philippinarum TaxID=129788 RepID=UPI00295ADF1B|nr:trimethylamine monooxygenase-like [Ruditapes philippinarum]
MYKDLWTNAPKEISVEYPDYTFEQHFGQPISSYPPVSVVRNYLEGRWQNAATHDLKRYIRFNTVVRHVRFQDDKDNFLVITENLKIRETKEEEFTHVIVCNGIFNVPNMPYFIGFEDFSGRIMHSHDFKEANEFRGQRVLIIGSSFSAEDVAIHCLKFGATHIIISYRSKATGLKWLPGIEERPLVKNFKKKKAFFKDDTQAEVDVVICCTGYKNCFPFLESRLRIDEETSFYPEGLYKSSLFLKAGNRKLFYIGAQHQLYTLSLFENIAIWVCRYIMETLPDEPVSQTDMEKDSKEMHARASMLITNNDVLEFQTDVMKDLVSRTGRTVDFEKIIEYIKLWFDHREEGIENYRNHCFRSMYTGTFSPKQVPFMEAFDDSLETFLKNK